MHVLSPLYSQQWRTAMTWLRIDDAFYDHPKVVGLSLEARGLWVTGLTYAGRYSTDGLVPIAVVHRQGINSTSIADDLVQSGLWEACEKGYMIHDYLQYNPSKEYLERQKEARIEAGKAGGQASAQARALSRTQATTQRTSNGRSSKIQPRTRTPIVKNDIAREAFETWWKLYPRKIGKQTALDAWNRLTDAERTLASENLPRLLPYYAESNIKYIPHASTWLNQKRWTDEPHTVASTNGYRSTADEFAKVDPSKIY